MTKKHHYKTTLIWTGNKGKGTKNYRSYTRDHDISTLNKQSVIPGSSDPSFRGDPTRYNPEELLVSSLSSCHMLWYLHLCSVNQVNVISYEDHAVGTMCENEDGSGQFSEVTLKPKVTVSDQSMIAMANALHGDANKMCFIARSCNFKITHIPEINVVE